jgi:hypothetical protein
MMRNLKSFLFLFFFSLSIIAFGQSKRNIDDSGKRSYTTKRIIDKAPIIDGYADDEAWNIVEWAGGFTQHDPFDGAEPTEETAFKILYDDNFLYVLVRSFDSEPDKIVRRMSRRDGFEGDFVEINIDSYFDKRTAFSFTASVSGVKGDEAITNDGDRWDRTWDPIWYLKTSIDDKGWIAEFKIPFTQLRFSNEENQTWGLQVTRRYFRNEERSNWVYVSKDNSGWVRHFGELRGIKNIKPKRQVELYPYVLGKTEVYKKEDGNPFSKGTEFGYSVGIDGKIGLTNDFILDFTINPDFGQIEADPSEVNLTAFETYFREKRPFFIEGREITSFQLSGGGNSFSRDNLFYSRRIGRSPHHYPDLQDGEYADVPNNTTILGALKLTGKTKNGLSLGLIESITAEEKALIDFEGDTYEQTVEPMTNYFVARMQKDLNDNNTIVGGMFTSTNRFIKEDHLNYLNKNAFSGGLDLTQYFKDKKYHLTFKLAGSHLTGDSSAMILQQESSRRYFQRPDHTYSTFDSTLTSFTGYSGTIEAGKLSQKGWRWLSWITWRSPKYETNDVGFLSRSDAIFQVFWLSYRWSEPFSIFRSMQVSMDQWTGWDFGGNLNFYGTNFGTFMEFKNHWRFHGGVGISGDGISNNLLRGGPSILLPGEYNYRAHLNTDRRKKVHFGFGTNHGYGFEGSGYRHHYSIDIVYKPINALSIAFLPDYSISKDELQFTGTESVNGEDRYIFADIKRITTDLTVRIDYSITPNLTIQYYGSPFVSSGDYSDAKYITDTKADRFEERFNRDMSFSGVEDYPAYLDENYDFNFRQFRSNFVLRWEYRPGSLVYLVWTQSRTGVESKGNFTFTDDYGGLFETDPYNVFLIKLSYAFF